MATVGRKAQADYRENIGSKIKNFVEKRNFLYIKCHYPCEGGDIGCISQNEGR